MPSSSRLARLGRTGRRANRYEDLSGSNVEERRLSAVNALQTAQFHMDFDSAASEIELTAAAMAGVIADDVFSVDQAVNKMGFGKFQIKLSLVTGLSWMADSMEMMILSILSPALNCSWGISNWKQATITTVVFLGMMISATFWGSVSDRYGRKKTLFTSVVLLSYYGFLSSFSPNYVWLLILRGSVGFAVGCVPQSVTLYAEFLPVSQRAACIVLLELFWALGACLEVLLALFIMPSLGWRWLLGFSTLPAIIFILTYFWLPESARFDAATGNSEAALNTLNRIAKENGKVLPPGRLIIDDTEEVKRGRFLDLLIPEFRITTLLLWFIWFVCALCYYGVVLMTTELFRTPSKCYEEDFGSSDTCHAACAKLKTSDYVDLLWTSIAEFPGIFITAFVIEKIGRKKTMAAEFIFFAIFVLLLLICNLKRVWLTVILFGARAIVSGVFQAAFVYTPELTLTFGVQLLNMHC